jgi:hypothetical protein
MQGPDSTISVGFAVVVPGTWVAQRGPMATSAAPESTRPVSMDHALRTIRAWSLGYELIDPARVPGMVRACMEIEPFLPGCAIETAKISLLVCALDDVVDGPGGPSNVARDALLAELTDDLQGLPASAPIGGSFRWAVHHDAICDFGRRGGGVFVRELCKMLDAMREEVRWRSRDWPDLDTYLAVGWRSISAPALFTWLAVDAGLALDAHPVSRELLRETGLALRLANDLSDGGREAKEGKANAVHLLRSERGCTDSEARSLLAQEASAHLKRAYPLAAMMPRSLERWSRAVLSVSAYMVEAYESHGDFA